jgi:biopolymer transport protein ExbD
MSVPIHTGSRGKRRQGLVHKAPKNESHFHSEINVTPLVDVCLVLLIIFMLISQLLSRGREVPLPQTLHHETEADQNQPIVAIDEEGKLFFDKEQVPSMKVLKQKVVAAWRERDAEEMRVYVKAAQTLSYKKVYPLIMAVRDLGVTKIELGTVEKKE